MFKGIVEDEKFRPMQFEKDGGAVGTWIMVQVSTLTVSIVILNEYQSHC